MAGINTGGTTNGIVSVTGQYELSQFTTTNLRASHTIMVRIKSALTTTNYTSFGVAFSAQSVTSSFSGSFIGRFNGDAGTGISCWRQNDNASPTRQKVVASTSYGNTTTWYHVTLAYDAPNALIRTYVDGVATGTIASATTAAKSSTANNITGVFHQGKMADLALFNRLLTPAEIALMANYRVPQVTSGLQLFWRLDTNANDSSGNGRNGTITGSGSTISFATTDNPPQPETNGGDQQTSSAFAGALTVSVPLAGAETSISALSGALNTTKPMAAAAASSSVLTGQVQSSVKGNAATTSALAAWIRPRWGRRANSSASLSSFDSFSNSAPWTVMTWRRSITLGAAQAIYVEFGGGSDSLSLGVQTGSPGTLRLRLIDTPGTTIIDYTTTDDGLWHHMAIAFDGTTARAYLDGALVASGNPTLTGTWGQRQWGGGPAGLTEYAHTKIWAGAALSTSDITRESVYYTPSSFLSSLYAWWQLSWQNVTLDSSGNGHTLTDNSSLEAQTESPGQPLALVYGNAATTSALAGALNTLKPIAAAATTASALAGNLTALLSGAASTSSAFSGQLGYLLSGSATSVSLLAGSLTAQLSAVASTSSAFAGALLAQLTGALSTSSSFSGTIGVNGLFVGNAATSSAFNGALNLQIAESGNLTTASTLAAALQAQLLGAQATSSALAGQLSALLTTGGLATTTALQGSLTAGVLLAGNATTSSALAATLKQLQGVQGSLATATAWAGTLSVATAVLFRGDAASTSLFSGALSLLVPTQATGFCYTTGSCTAYYTVVAPPIGPLRRWPPRPR